MLNARISALSAQIESGDEGIESGADVLSLLPFASIETLRRYAALEEREATLLRSAVDSKARGLAVVNALRVSHEFAREFVARLAGWDDDLSSAEAIIAVVHDCTRTIAEALKLIETFASDVRALSDDWRAAYERWLSTSAQRALSRWRELSERTRASLRAMIAESAVDERSKRWALDDAA